MNAFTGAAAAVPRLFASVTSLRSSRAEGARYLAVIALMLMTGCASVPRDEAHLAVRGDVAARTGSDVEWQREARSADDPRVQAMLNDPLTAERAVAIAMINNPRLQVILAEAGIAEADLIEASTLPNPILELETRSPARPYRPFEVTLAQSLIELLQLPRRREVGRAAMEVAKTRITAEVLRFSSEVRSSYFDAVAASQHLSLTASALEGARASTELAIRQHAAGNITDLDLENEQAVYEEAKIELAKVEEDLLLRKERLTRSLGLRASSDAIMLAATFPPLPVGEAAPEELTAAATERRLDIELARRELQLAQRLSPTRRASALGEVVVDVHLEREPEGERTIGPGIEFPIPLFNRGRAARLRAESEIAMREHALAEVIARAGSEVRAARARVESARMRAEYYRDVVIPRRERIVQLTKLEQNAMLAGVYQLLQARQNELDARRDYVEAQRDYWSARNDLERALNGSGDSQSEPAAGSSARRGNSMGEREGH